MRRSTRNGSESRSRRGSRPAAVLAAAAIAAGGAATLMIGGAGEAAAAPTGCVSGSVVVAAASYCSGGTGEHRVTTGCVPSQLYATVFPASGRWAAPGSLSVVTIGQPFALSDGSPSVCVATIGSVVSTR